MSISTCIPPNAPWLSVCNPPKPHYPLKHTERQIPTKPENKECNLDLPTFGIVLSLRVKINNLEASSNIPMVSKLLLEECQFIHRTKLPEVEQALYALQQRRTFHKADPGE